MAKLKGKKYDSGKPRVSLLSSDAILEIAKVATMGAAKYSDHNWRGGMKWSRLMDAAERHLLDYNRGNRVDKESHLSHLAHVAWNIMALLEYEINNSGEDDLWKGYKNEPKRVSKKRRSIGKQTIRKAKRKTNRH
jgi:hypothetical protein